jgi:DNA-binding transcriptional regulator YdaS (Cro superfamily)
VKKGARDASDDSDIVAQAVTAAGGAHVVAKKFEISRQAVEKWVKQGWVPAERVLGLEALSGVSRHRLAPDIYPRGVAA